MRLILYQNFYLTFFHFNLQFLSFLINLLYFYYNFIAKYVFLVYIPKARWCCLVASISLHFYNNFFLYIFKKIPFHYNHMIYLLIIFIFNLIFIKMIIYFYGMWIFFKYFFKAHWLIFFWNFRVVFRLCFNFKYLILHALFDCYSNITSRNHKKKQNTSSKLNITCTNV